MWIQGLRPRQAPDGAASRDAVIATQPPLSTVQLGKWAWTGGNYAAPDDRGIKTSGDARFFSLSAPFDAEFHNSRKDLIVSYTVKHEQAMDVSCGGAYIKVRELRTTERRTAPLDPLLAPRAASLPELRRQ